MKKRRPCARNYSLSQRHIYERLPIRAKSIHDFKGQDSRRIYLKLQQNNRKFDNGLHLKKDTFYSLESLFDIRKLLNLSDAYQLAFDYCNDKSIEEKSIDTIKSEPLVEILYLQSLLPRENFERCINEPIERYLEKNVRDELKTSQELRTETLDIVGRLQQNTFYNKENYIVSIAERRMTAASMAGLKEYLEMLEQRYSREPGEEEARDVELPRIEHPEEKLPRVIICGPTEDGLPKIVIADIKWTPEKLKKVELQKGRSDLEQALLKKDQNIKDLEWYMYYTRAEIDRDIEEKREPGTQIEQAQPSTSAYPYTDPGVFPPSLSSDLPSSPPSSEWDIPPRLTGGGSATEELHLEDNTPQNVKMCTRCVTLTKTLLPQGSCPAELKDKFTTYDTSAKQLEQQLGSMESELRNMQTQLANVQKERQQLEQQRKLLKCTGPCASCTCPSPLPLTCGTPSELKPKEPMTMQAILPKYTCTSTPVGISAQQQLRDLCEQYARLQEDYKNKLYEVSCLRTDAEKMKQDLRDAKEEKERVEIKLIDVQERLKFLEEDRGNFEGHKEQLIEQEQALMVAKQRVRETQDELEELRSTTQDLSVQLEDYRKKYLQAQEHVEEQRRQMDLMEMDNARMNENVTLEIGRVKNQFQEKLAELAPLPEILKQAQTKLQETQQIRLIAERNCEDLSRELQACKDKLQIQQKEMEVLRAQYQTLLDERGQGTGRFDEVEKKCGELRNENERMKNTLTRLEEQKAQFQKRMDEKMHENAQLLSQLDQVREESARQVARTKDRCENQRWSMQRQIAEMEKELAQCRATARAAQRDRDEIRQKMQGQINNLNEAFEQAQGRIRSLQGHVNYLKTSYSNMLIGQKETSAGIPAGDAPSLGYDSCDCNY